MTKHVLTLIANPETFRLEETHVAAARAALEQAGTRVMHAEWLAERQAHDSFFMSEDSAPAEEAVRAALGELPIDAVIQESGNRKKRLLISDMDSTIITIECIDEIADFAGVKPQVAAITERAMAGELDFRQALKERVALLAGLPEAVLRRVYDERLVLMPGAKELVATMRAEGAYCVLVSGGFTFFTSRVKEEAGFDIDHSNRLEIVDGKLTGRVLEPILDKNSKLEILLETCRARGISLADTLAVGDGANDLPMLLAAGMGVAYRAKPLVREHARARLNHADLRGILYVQGVGRKITFN